MGGGGSSSAPVFNAQAAAQQQTTSNINTAAAQAALNNVNQVTPYGNLTYTQSGSTNIGGNDVPQYTATQTLSPDQQQLLDYQTALEKQALGGIAPGVLNQVQNSTSQPLNFNNAPAMPTDETSAINTAFNALMSRQNQNNQIQTQQEQAQLANQGIAPGSAAYDNAMRPIQQAQTDAINQAELNATGLAGQNINQAQTLRNQTINEDTALYNSPLQTYSSLLGLSGSPQSPNFTSTPQESVQPTDVAGLNLAQYQGQLSAYNQGQANNQATMGGLFGLGGSILGGLASNRGLFSGAGAGANSLGGLLALGAVG